MPELHPNHWTTVEQAERMHRTQLIQWLVWNDPNGIYTDEDCKREEFEPLTLGGAMELVCQAIRRSLITEPCGFCFEDHDVIDCQNIDPEQRQIEIDRRANQKEVT